MNLAPAQLDALGFAAPILTYRACSQIIKQKRDCSQSTPIQIISCRHEFVSTGNVNKDFTRVILPCEQRFLSCMAFNALEVVRVVCLSRSLFFYALKKRTTRYIVVYYSIAIVFTL